jgi:hypothetical protein
MANGIAYTPFLERHDPDLYGPMHEYTSYRLRSGGTVPIGVAQFVLQSFGREDSGNVIFEATAVLPISEDFMGANIVGPYSKGSFQRLPYLAMINSVSYQVFNGSVVKRPEFKDEDTLPGS